MFQYIHAEVYARKACTNPKNKTKYCIDDIIGEVIRDPAHSEAIANPQPPRYIISSEAGLKGMLMKIKENAANYRDKMGRKMREDAPVLVAGVASFPREIAEKDPDLYARWESLTVAYLQGKYGDNLRAVVMHNDEEQPHIHFYVYSDTEVNAKALHYGHKAKKNFIAASKAFQDDYHAQVAIHCGMARLGPKKQRLTRAEWKAQKEHAMKVAAAESALLDAAAQREVNAAKQERANADTAAVLAEEKRKARDAITQAHEAMQEAKRLQAEANAKYAAAEAVLEKFGLADVPPQPTPPQKGAEATPAGEFGL